MTGDGEIMASEIKGENGDRLVIANVGDDGNTEWLQSDWYVEVGKDA